MFKFKKIFLIRVVSILYDLLNVDHPRDALPQH